MDSQRFDRFTRLIGAGTSRRQVLGAVAGGALAAVAGLGRADAAAKRSAGNSCRSNSDCASGLCVQESRTRKICHCGSVADCPAGDVCRTPVCQANGYCGVTINVGLACDDGSLCTSNDVCQPDGSCHGTPKNCDDNNACTADSCDPATGLCVFTPIDCNDGNPCTVDSCDVVNGCVHTPVADGTLCDNGGGAGSGYCQSAACVDAHPACVYGNPDFFSTCPPGQYCYTWTNHCVCHIGSCSSAGDCGTWGGCFAGCCCAPDDSPNVGCAPGHNNDCCSGWCGSNGRCAPKPT